MTASEMQYDFKQKLNRLDSQKYRDLQVPEIDWKLNEAYEVFVKIVAQPRVASEIGYESNQRTIDDIRVVVIEQGKGQGIVPTLADLNDSSFNAILPPNYWLYINSKLTATKGSCTARLNVREMSHDDSGESSPFDKSSFLWREANIRFYSGGIKILTGGDFVPTELNLEYIRKLTLIHNAEEYDPINGYFLGGVQLTGHSNCELPEPVHREIVDIAVLITSGDLVLPSYMIKRYKTTITDRK